MGMRVKDGRGGEEGAGRVAAAVPIQSLWNRIVYFTFHDVKFD